MAAWLGRLSGITSISRSQSLLTPLPKPKKTRQTSQAVIRVLEHRVYCFEI